MRFASIIKGPIVATFSTIKQAVDYLVSVGIQEPFAKVAMDQNYNCDIGQPGIPWTERKLCASDKPNTDTPIEQTERDILDAWQCRFESDHMEMTPEGIKIYDDLVYDKNGDSLSNEE